MRIPASNFIKPALAVLLALLTAAVFWPATGHPICSYDDPVFLDSSGHARPAVPGADQAFGESPLAWTTLRWDDRLIGHGVFGHHLGNVLLHALAAAAVFLFLERLTGSTWRSALVAALFALHPLRVEPVAWIAERKEVQGGFLGFVTLAMYVIYCRQMGHVWKRRACYIAMLTLFGIALFSKPTTITLPFVMLLLDFWVMRRVGPGRLAGGPPEDRFTLPVFPTRPLKFILAEKAPLLVLMVISAVNTYCIQQQGGALIGGAQLALSSRLANAAVSYVRYMIHTVWFAGLALPYPLRQWPAWAIAGSLGVLVGVTATALAAIRRRPLAAIGWLWFLGTLVPMIGLVQVGGHAMADRYAYIPSVGLLVCLIWLIPENWAQRRNARPLLAGIAAVVVVAIGRFARIQLSYWTDDATLFSHAIAVTSENASAQGELGIVFMNARRLDEAEIHLREAMRLEPTDVSVSASLARVLSRKGHHEEAVLLARQAAAAGDRFHFVHLALGEALEGAGRLQEAAVEYLRATELAPDDPRGHYRLGLVLAQLGRSGRSTEELRIAAQQDPALGSSHRAQASLRAAAGDFAGAVAEYRNGLLENPNSTDLEIALGSLLSDHGDHGGAMRHFERALAIDPRNANALINRGLEHAAAGHVNEARADYQAALASEPDNADAHLNLGGLLQSLGQSEASAAHSRRALELRPGSFEAAFNLAIAESSLGRLASAETHLRLALKLQPGDPDAKQELANVLARRLR